MAEPDTIRALLEAVGDAFFLEDAFHRRLRPDDRLGTSALRNRPAAVMFGGPDDRVG